MGFEIAPDPGERGEPVVKIGRSGVAAVGEQKRLIPDGVRLLARGAHEFVRGDIVDTRRNEVRIVARVVDV